jgi:glycosyltransferase involved in cell wall biosynthesis
VRISHAYKDFYPPLAGGIMGYVRDIADEAAWRGHDVEVNTTGVRWARRETLPSGVVVSRHREFARVLSTPFSTALVKAVRQATADVLHVHMPCPPSELGALLNDNDVPLVLSYHSQLGRQRFLEPVYGLLRRRVLDRAAIVLVSTLRLQAAPELSEARAKVRVLPYGVSPRLVAERPVGPVHDGPLRVLFVGRLVYYKGVDVLLRAVAGEGETMLTVVGDGALRADLERLVAELGLLQRVRFTGPLDDAGIREAYATHDVLALPSVSRAEAFGLVMIEAMANGLPVISTGLGTGTDVVNVDGETGFVVAPGDSGALALALKQIAPSDVRRELGGRARQRAREHYSFDRHIEGLLRMYEEVAA